MKNHLVKLSSKLKSLNIKVAEEVEELAESIETSNSKTPLVQDLKEKISNVEDSNDLELVLVSMMSYVRAMHTWFHGAHHVTGGTGFAGDHSSLYSRIYEDIQGDFDDVAEKAVGLVGEEAACPVRIMQNAAKIIAKYKSPCDLSADEIADEGLSIIESYLKFLEKAYQMLKKKNLLTLGLDDFIMSMANDYETFVYLLKQRSSDE
jgi:DNA-binding ferritin-like protein